MYLQLQLPVSDFGLDHPMGAGHAVVGINCLQYCHIYTPMASGRLKSDKAVTLNN